MFWRLVLIKQLHSKELLGGRNHNALFLPAFYQFFFTYAKAITIASTQINTGRPVNVKVVTVSHNGQPPRGVVASRKRDTSGGCDSHS